ncbi:transcription factor GTE4-like [Rhodamnia argentea]|uniref:Transcription factor GTE4-like n=1 Tax=Rhodamnia argentea TaxID=178133 RepID=A0A8B8N5F5_9MYRT|nr:transcription factor GTE4-like [Rhodamnia argentea]
MASGPIVGGDDGAREKQRYAESKVYTRKSFKGLKKDAAANNTNTDANANTNTNADADADATNAPAVNPANDLENHDDGNSAKHVPSQTIASEDDNSAQQPPSSRVDVASENSGANRQEPAEPSPREPPSGNGSMVTTGLDGKVKINLSSRSKQEIRDLRRKLQSELDTVRNLVKKIEDKEGHSIGFSNSRLLVNDAVDNGPRMVHSEVGSVGVTPRENRALNQLSISVFENSQGMTDSLEKEKRTPKANQFYRNSEFLLAKDKFPPAESNKKSKTNGKKKGGEVRSGLGMGTKFFKSCSSLLDKLMKHEYGWVFNTPVDVKGLGLHDYYSIIKHPMDLGTVKTRLNRNWYKSPKEFAEDVRLTFDNAMTYNPAGQDVHVMAEILFKIFEDRWAIIESDYNREIRFALDYDMGLLPTPTSRKAFPRPPPLDMRRILDRSESMAHPSDMRLKPFSVTPSGRTPAPKKPKAKDPHKRDMTYDEKQKLSTNLQNLPSDKLDNIVQIIKKRNSSLFQHDDEIEVDIDSVDTETLWELDRFVTNYKKSLSKNKRKAELAMQARAEAQQNVPDRDQATVVVEAPKETDTGQKIVSSSLPVQSEGHGPNSSHSSSSNSSSSDSGSSSSDSDSDSSSASGSEAGHSPRT